MLVVVAVECFSNGETYLNKKYNSMIVCVCVLGGIQIAFWFALQLHTLLSFLPFFLTQHQQHCMATNICLENCIISTLKI